MPSFVAGLIAVKSLSSGTYKNLYYSHATVATSHHAGWAFGGKQCNCHCILYWNSHKLLMFLQHQLQLRLPTRWGWAAVLPTGALNGNIGGGVRRRNTVFILHCALLANAESGRRNSFSELLTKLNTNCNAI